MSLAHGPLLVFAGLFAVLFIMNAVLQRRGVSAWFCFFLNYFVITGLLVLGRHWFDWRLLPQPNRFELEFELAFSALAAWIGQLLWDHSPRALRTAMIVALAALCTVQAVRFRGFAHAITQPIDIATTIEYRMAKWFDANMQGRRVFAPGSVSLWMNLFTDTPQVAGCCDQGIPTWTHRIAYYIVYTGDGTGDRDAAISRLWMAAYGADAVAVTGPGSREAYHPFLNPRKFEGVLPVLWREDDNTVYDLGRRQPSLAHVIPSAAVVQRPPVNGIDVGPLERYVSAMDAPEAPPAETRWVNRHELRITTNAPQQSAVSIQVSWDAGWRATVNGQNEPVSADGLGMMVVRPHAAGLCTIDLVWDDREARWTHFSFFVGALILAAWIAARLQNRNKSG